MIVNEYKTVKGKSIEKIGMASCFSCKHCAEMVKQVREKNMFIIYNVICKKSDELTYPVYNCINYQSKENVK